MIALGTDSAWRVRQLSGGLIATYRWLDDEPCLFLHPAGQQRGGAMAVPLSSAHLWAHSNGHPDLSHAIPAAVRGAKTMGLCVTHATIRHIVDAVVDGLPDLLDMPPAPASRTSEHAPVVGEASIQVDGETVLEREIRA